MFIKSCYFLVGTLVLVGCGSAAVSLPPITDFSKEVTITQGVWGRVFFLQGSFFPNQNPPQGVSTPISRKIYFFPPTDERDVISTLDRVFFLSFPTLPVRVVESREDGFFEVALPPGRYTMVVKEPDGYWASSAEGNTINPITVTTNEVTEIELRITYEAAF